ncbi:hypothetical protein GCM10007103_17290 [Salinimicrobium marinum]|uniref:CarboxypepD_reg-like domain-containing protein n=1 Tax=Salinimicrobium marinum TaxID=680283 RepID=A0A918SD83_9FLAO|nr:carboxypeptidase-like regulatory domain-containing protein [Salinimicrobium marinum]GHA36317.1 hypothetical protein GCM10007103_17290 [Salinimicrobium marinum]
MNNTFLFLVLLICFSLNAIAQEKLISGAIKDAESNQPLAYVNIGIFNKSIGTVSSEKGEFRLKLPANVQGSDTLVFSYIGYDAVKKLVSDLNSPVQISMNASEDQLEEVVLDTKAAKPKRIGRTNNGLGLLHYNFYTVYEEDVDDRLSKELGMKFRLNKDCRVEKFNLSISQNEFKTLKFRLNIYSLKDDLPDELLISDNIIFELKDKQIGWYTVDLDQYDIFLREELETVVISIQWVESEKADTESKFFSIPGSQSPFNKVYSRDKAMDSWKSQTGRLSMYIDAMCVD